ncbi:MAG: hypothetical protein EHM48_06300 [Planctomycetaceae bacterium]|nr:MAG: hypothetical protein EHM48_06300 [Planctomycetaceae bacterium]
MSHYSLGLDYGTNSVRAVVAGHADGGYRNFAAAPKAMTGLKPRVFTPDKKAHEVYKALYKLYLQMHDAMGTPNGGTNLYNIMKDLLAVRNKARG